MLTDTSRAALCACIGIPPAELRRRAASLDLASRAIDPDHLLHHTTTREETQRRLKSRGPFATSGKDSGS